MQFTLLNDYHNEAQQQQAKRAEYTNRVTEQEALVNALEFRYRDAIKRAVTSNEDTTQEVAEINAQLAAVKTELANRKNMLDIVRSVQKRTITTADLDRDFRAYRQQYQNSVIQPLIEQLRTHKVEYLKAELALQEKIKDFSDTARLVTMTINPRSVSVPYSVGYKDTPQREYASVTEFDLRSLQRGIVPTSIASEVNK
jgi:hypothetical protein